MDNTMGKNELWAFSVELIDEIRLGQKPKFVMAIEKIEDMKEDIQKWQLRGYKPIIRSSRRLSQAMIDYMETYKNWWKEVRLGRPIETPKK